MKIQTKNGLIEVPKIAKTFECFGEIFAVHRLYFMDKFSKDTWIVSHYKTGLSINVYYKTLKTIKQAEIETTTFLKNRGKNFVLKCIDEGINKHGTINQ